MSNNFDLLKNLRKENEESKQYFNKFELKINKKQILIIIIAILMVSITICIYFNKTYGSSYYYIDSIFHPEKYSYNYFVSNIMIKDDMHNYEQNQDYDTIYLRLKKHRNKYSNQKNENAKIIQTNINELFDLYNAIGANDYKNIHKITLNKENIDKIRDKDVLQTIVLLNVVVPELEKQSEIFKSISDKNTVLKKTTKYFKTNDIKAEATIKDVSFFDFSTDDDYFKNIVKDSKNIDKSQKIKDLEKEAQNIKYDKNDTFRNMEKYENIMNKYSMIKFSYFQRQYIIDYKSNDGNKYNVKIKLAENGNREYWNYIVVFANNEQLSNLIRNFALEFMKNNLQNALGNLFNY